MLYPSVFIWLYHLPNYIYQDLGIIGDPITYNRSYKRYSNSIIIAE